ncbi:hypothetical protein Plhal304r1_c050g0133371 [Plasmopara halstedii]
MTRISAKWMVTVREHAEALISIISYQNTPAIQLQHVQTRRKWSRTWRSM